MVRHHAGIAIHTDNVYYIVMNIVTYKRINITLPERTVALLDRVADKGERSRVIDNAVRAYVAGTRREQLRQDLAEGYVATAQQDALLSEKWFPIEQDVWQQKSA
jgi:CopG family transcriptional regulator / antitoxin EndoAI